MASMPLSPLSPRRAVAADLAVLVGAQRRGVKEVSPGGTLAPPNPSLEADFVEASSRDVLDRASFAFTIIAVLSFLYFLVTASFAPRSIWWQAETSLVLALAAAGARTPWARARARAASFVVELVAAQQAAAFTSYAELASTCTIIAVASMMLSVIVVRPSGLGCAAILAAPTAAWALVGAGVLSVEGFTAMRGGGGFAGTPPQAVLVAAGIATGATTWALQRAADRAAFAVAHELQRAVAASTRVLSALLPRSVLPAVLAHIDARGSLAGAPVTSALEVVIVFLRLPRLGAAPFPGRAQDAVARLGALWATADAVFATHGLATLEVTDTEMVAVAGLGGAGGGAAEAGASEGALVEGTAAALRACLALGSALPREFAAVARAGVHTGSVLAGFVGSIRPRYCLVGDAMNTASRVADAAAPGSTVASSEAYARVRQGFEARARAVELKGKGVCEVFDVAREAAAGGARAGRAGEPEGGAAEPPGSAPARASPLPSEGGGAALEAEALTQQPPRAPPSGAALPLATLPQPHHKQQHAAAPPAPSLDLTTPPARTVLRGFTDAALEARFEAYHFASGLKQLHPMQGVIAGVLAYVVLSDAFPAPPSWPRAVANLALCGAWLLLSVGTLLRPSLPSALAYRGATFAALILGFPLVAQRASTACYATIVLTLSPTPCIRALPQVLIKGLRVLLITLLQVGGYYAAELTPPAPWPGYVGQTDAPLVWWLWAAWMVTATCIIGFEGVAARRYAEGEALARAHEAGAAALEALLPPPTAAALAQGAAAAALTTENADVAVLVADLVGFTALAAVVADPAKVFAVLNAAVRDFEACTHAEGAFKVKTVGDCIVVASGLRDFPSPVQGGGANVGLLARVARGMHSAAAHAGLRLRVGIHVGAVVTGVVHSNGFTYDAWGEGVALAQAACVAAPPGHTLLTEAAVGALGAHEAAALALAPAPAPLDAPDGTAVRAYVATEAGGGSGGGGIGGAAGAGASGGAGASAAPPAQLPPECPPLTWSFDVLGAGTGSEAEAALPAAALALLAPALARCNGSAGSGGGGGAPAIAPAAADAAARALLASYGRHAFHNKFHAVAVLHAYTLLTRVPAFAALLSPAEAAVLGLAALGHDAGHGGVNNAFEVATASPIAARYGREGPVLERSHAAATAAALASSGVLAGFDGGAREGALHLVRVAIMATDMARHDAIVEDLERAGESGGGWASLSPAARAGALLHAADLAAQTFPRGVADAWSARIAEEFSAQAAREAALGLPGTPFMQGLEAPRARALMQARFVGGVVAPLWRALARLAEGWLDEPLRNVEANAAAYARAAEEVAVRLH